MDFKDFKVKRHSIKVWLEFLVQHNPLYKDNRINEDFLNELPENGSVLNSLTIENEAEILTNEKIIQMTLNKSANINLVQNKEVLQVLRI